MNFRSALPLIFLLIIIGCKKEDTPSNNPPSSVQLASITTAPVTSITATDAVGGGQVTDNGGSDIYTAGVCWGTASGTETIAGYHTSGVNNSPFTSNMNGLSPTTTYFVKAYVTNAAGTAYGNEVTFTTPVSPSCTGMVTDIDNNTYCTVQIGTQTWMSENLRTTHYRNGNPIPTSLTAAAWATTTSGAYYPDPTGNFYNWYTITDSRGLCPVGWHVPTASDWQTLLDYLGDGAFFKLSALYTNTSGFSANTYGYYGQGGFVTSIDLWGQSVTTLFNCQDRGSYGMQSFGYDPVNTTTGFIFNDASSSTTMYKVKPRAVDINWGLSCRLVKD